MLQAKTKNGELITLVNYSREIIEQLRVKKDFYCPTCSEKVLVRSGPQTVPHFSHYQKTECLSTLGGEGHYHEKGKLLLYQWLKSQNLNVSLEKHLPQISQRPDIYLVINNKKVAIEYQCTRISIDRLQQRNEGYMQLGIQPIWILGANQLHRLSRSHIKIDPFTMRLIHHYNPQIPTHLYFFCPNTNQLIIANDIFVTTPRKIVAKLSFLKLQEIYFHNLFQHHSMTSKELHRLWQKEKRNFRLRRRDVPRGRELAWRQWLYLKRLPLESLPSEIYLPVRGQMLMKTPLWDWQSRLCLELIAPLQINDVFTLEDSFVLLQNHIFKQHTFPLLKPTIHPIQQYFELLSQLKIIKQVDSSYYKKVASIQLYSHIDKALEGDRQLLNRLFGKI